MSSNDKSRGKHSKDQKSTAKSGSSAQATVSTEVEPQNLGFLYTIDALDVAYDDKHPERMLMLGGKTGNDVAHFWFPPNRAKMFKRRNGNLYRWRAEETQLVEDIQRPEKKVEVASVFFQVRTDNFLAVFKDCAKYNISEEDIGWSQVGFHHNPGLVSEVDLAGQYDQLAASADGSSWLPQVIPGVYNYDRNPAAKRVGKSGGLCGRLSLLIAMAAFSAEESFAENVVSKCFRHGVWKKHQFETGVGRYKNRGVVVSIYLDPEARGVTAAHLRAFERGDYGPIFEYTQSQQGTATQQAPSYTLRPTAISPSYGGPSAVPRFSYQVPTTPSGYAAPGGYAIPSGYTSQTGYAPPSGNTAPSGYAPPSMAQSSQNIYDENDDDDEQEEKGT